MDTYADERGYEGNYHYHHTSGAANAPNGRYGDYGHSELETSASAFMHSILLCFVS